MSSPQPAMPQFVGRYELLVPIASGGMATVYLARQKGVGGFTRDVALKLTHGHLRSQPEWVREIIEEAKLGSRIRHPNVVAILDVDDDPLGVFLVMEYIAGDTVAALARREMKSGGVIPLAIALRVMLDALDGLHASHELRDDNGELCNLVHRDFSPQNLIVGVDGMTRLTDFGVAKASSRLGATSTGTIKGKFAYMAPEQARDLPLDRRTDVWAAGVVTWELFTGKRLYTASDQTSVLLKIVTEVPPPASLVRPSIGDPLSTVIEHALRVEASERFPSAIAFRDAILEVCKVSNITVASRDDVARYVQEAAKTVLSEREELIRQVTESRRTLAPANVPTVSVAAHANDTTDAISVNPAPKVEPRTNPRRERLIALAVIASLATLGVAFGRNVLHGDRSEQSTAPRASEPPSASRVTPQTSTANIESSRTAAASSDLAPSVSPPEHVRPVLHSASSARAAIPLARATVSAVPTASAATRPPLRPNPYEPELH